MREIYACEVNYTKQFCIAYENQDFIKFTDPLIPDMYFHNFMLIKNETLLRSIVTNGLNQLNNSFLRFEYNGHLSEELISTLSVEPKVTRYDLMGVNPNSYQLLRMVDECEVIAAHSPRLLTEAVDLEQKLSPSLGEFALRKIKRKILVYETNKVTYFICFYKGKAVGSCELFIDQYVAKIEEFQVLDDYKRMGIGSSLLRHVLQVANLKQVDTAYVVTDQEDTAKEMYAKCGFTKMGEKTELFYKIRE